MSGHKYEIGDRIFIRDDSNSWYVIGVQMRPSYNLVCWQYYLGRAVYGDYPISRFGGSCDVETKGPVREDEIESEGSRLLRGKEELNEEIQKTEKRLSELKADLLES